MTIVRDWASNSVIVTGEADDVVQPGNGRDIVTTGAGRDLLIFDQAVTNTVVTDLSADDVVIFKPFATQEELDAATRWDGGDLIVELDNFQVRFENAPTDYRFVSRAGSADGTTIMATDFEVTEYTGTAGYDRLILDYQWGDVFRTDGVTGIEEIVTVARYNRYDSGIAVVLADSTAVAGTELRIVAQLVDGSAETDARLIIEGGGQGGALGDRISGGRDLAGNGGDDVLTGGFNWDTVFRPIGGRGWVLTDYTAAQGGDGDDEIWGMEGDDWLKGDAGSDLIIGGVGNDLAVFDGPQSDYEIAYLDDGGIRVSSVDGVDLLYSVEQLIFIENGSGISFGVPVADRILTGGSGDDRLLGGKGDDRFDGGAGADFMSGEDGSDHYVIDHIGDVVFDAMGEFDTAESSVSTRLRGIEQLTLTGTADIGGSLEVYSPHMEFPSTPTGTIIGNAGANRLFARDMRGGAGNDTYVILAAYQTIEEAIGGGVDTVESAITYTLGSALDRLVLTGRANIDGTGNALNNIITGNAGRNVLVGGGGFDRLYGGAGNDVFHLDEDDLAFEAAAEGVDLVFTPRSLDLRGNHIENATLTGIADAWLIGNADGNVLRGNDGANRLNGMEGGDTLIGGKGNDIYTVDDRLDRVVERSGEGVDRVNSSVTYNGSGADIEVIALTGTANIDAVGNGLDNVLIGNDGNNKLNGGLGADRMQGGQGHDTYYVDNVADQVIELLGQGVDTVLSSITFDIRGLSVENVTLIGSARANLIGNDVSNILRGNAAANVIFGGGGADVMTGGAGADRFDFNAVSDSTYGIWDRITDLTNEDIIDLSSIDANVNVAGNQAFTLVTAFTGQAGQIMLSPNIQPYFTLLSADVDGDRVADMRIVLDGNQMGFFHFIL